VFQAMLRQIILNGIVGGFSIGMLALGFSVLCSSARFFVFTYGAAYSCAAYSMLACSRWTPLPIASCMGVLVGVGLSVVLEACIYRPIRERGRSSLVLMLASIGAYTVIQNCLSLEFGDATVRVQAGELGRGFALFGARMTNAQVIIVVSSLAAFLVSWFLLERTGFGVRLRAVVNDAPLAHVVGVKESVVAAQGTALGAGLAGVAGVVMSFDLDLVPMMGFTALLWAMVAGIVGGMQRASAVMLAGLFIGLVQNLSVWKLPTEWQDCILFVILIIFLVVRPTGFMGKPADRTAI
jgi:branched-chain amino acid transport system permease protein